MTSVLKHLIKFIGSLTIPIALNPLDLLARLEEAQLIERFTNHQTSSQLAWKKLS